MNEREHFDQRAPTYDEWWLADRPGWAAEVEQLVGVVAALPPAGTLDVACGTGFLTQHLRGEITALDRSAPMLEVAAARMPAARVVQGEAVPLPFDDGAFDRVFTSLFLHHLAPDARDDFVAEARRVARELVVIEVVKSFGVAELAAELGDSEVLHESASFAAVVARW